MTTKAIKRRMSRAASLGCAICRRMGFEDSPAELHHPRTGTGMARRASDEDVIPLCDFHHRHGPDGLHFMGVRAWERKFGVTEMELIAETQALLRMAA